MDKAEIEKLRGVDLEIVFQDFNCVPDERDKRNWRTPGRERISVDKDDSQKFYNHDALKGGYGAIDLTMQLGGVKFTEAVAHLAKIAGTPEAIRAYQFEAKSRAEKIIKETKAPDFTEVPQPDPSRLQRVIRYLAEERGIDLPVVQRAIGNGRLWADSYGNAVFSLRDPNLTGKQMGAELRGTIPGKPFHGVRGTEKGFFFTGDAKSMNAVFVESAIEGLSYECLDTNALVVSTTGSRKETLQLVAQRLHERGFQVYAGFNLDKTGNQLKNNLREALGENTVPQKIPPAELLQHFEKMTGKPGKDWNDALRAHVDLSRNQEKQSSSKHKAKVPAPELER